VLFQVVFVSWGGGAVLGKRVCCADGLAAGEGICYGKATFYPLTAQGWSIYKHPGCVLPID
jgi:hypothetical protein